MHRITLLALVLLAGCASTPNEIAEREALDTLPITGSPKAVAECIAGEYTARGLKPPLWMVETVRRADSWMVLGSLCGVLGCATQKRPTSLLLIDGDQLTSHGLPIRSWHETMPDVIEACEGAA
jgi:hypothetical protein